MYPVSKRMCLRLAALVVLLLSLGRMTLAQMPATSHQSAGSKAAVRPIYRAIKQYPHFPQPNGVRTHHSHMVGPVDRTQNSGATRGFADTSVGTHPDAGGIQPNAAGITSTSFPAIGYTGSIPPDPNGAVGPNHYVAATNNTWAIYDKQGNQLYSIDFNSWFGSSDFFSDPHVIYDPWGNRFVIVILHINTGTHGAWWNVMVSNDSNPMDGFYYYQFNARQDGSTDQDQWADFPYVGYDSQALYISSTMFNFPVEGGSARYVKLRILNKSQLYSASTAGWWDFWNFTSNGSEDWFIAPAEEYTDPGEEYLINAKFYGANYVTFRRLTNPLNWTSGPSISTEFPGTQSFAPPPAATQPFGVQALENSDCRILNLAYYNGRLDASQMMAHDWGDGLGNRSVIHWLRFGNHNHPATVDRDYFWGAAGFDYFYPSVAVNSVGDTTLVFARSGQSEYASIRETGWRESTGETSPEGSALVRGGDNTYLNLDNGRNRWGDYFKACLDPFDFTTVWVMGQYATSTGFTWGTWVAETNWKPFTQVSVSNVSGVIGQTVTLSANLLRTDTSAPLIGETLTFKVNGSFVNSVATDGSGNASTPFTITPGLGTGAFTIEVDYDRTFSFNATKGFGTLSVSKASTSISVGSVTGLLGQTVALKARLKRTSDGAALSGETLNFKVGTTIVGPGTTDATGLATVNYTIPTNSSTGAKTITASFSGDSNHNASSGTNNLTVKAGTTLTATNAAGIVGQTVTLTATLKKTVTGTLLSGKTITFQVGATTVGTATTNTSGVASLAYHIPGIGAGAHTITASYAGDSTYGSSTATATLTITKASTKISVANVTGARGTTVTLKATLTRTTDGHVLSSKTVTFKVNTTTLGTATTSSTGLAQKSFHISSTATTGAKTITVTFAGDTSYNSSSGTGTLTVN